MSHRASWAHELWSRTTFVVIRSGGYADELMVNGQITSLGGGAPPAAKGRADAERSRRRVHHPQRHVALPHEHHGRLRHIRSLDDYADVTVLQGVTPHSFGRTVATEIDEVYDAEAAKNQLGHTSKTVTERHYINRKVVVPDYRAATERLAPGSGASDGVKP